MLRHTVYGVLRDRRGRITHLGIAESGNVYTAKDVMGFIASGEHEFYTVAFDQGDKHFESAKVYVRKDKKGGKMLTTKPDGTKQNNLDHLKIATL